VDRLAELRESQALTLRDLAERSGVDANTINQVELGHRKPRPSTLRKLARGLGIDVRDFFEEPVLAGKAEAGAEPSVYTKTGEQRVTPEQLRERGIEPNNSEVVILNQYLEYRERPPTGPQVFVHVAKKNEPVDHERVKTMLAYVLASGMLTKEETDAVRETLHDELVEARG